jgi:hypothetical protein
MGDAVGRFVALLELPCTLAGLGVTDEQEIAKVAENTLDDALAGRKNLLGLQVLTEILSMAT